jgi:hypothetical protein
VCLTVTDTNSVGNCTDTWCDTSIVVHFVQIYPNPVTSRVSVSLGNGSRPVAFQILDDKGRVVFRRDSDSGAGFSVGTEGMSSGIYFYQLIDGDRIVSTGKFVVVRSE